MNETEQKAVDMHRDFFARTKFAIENGFFIEAISMEYAAIESRLESICGKVGLSCNKECQYRKDIKISQRIQCLRKCRNQNNDLFETTKLPKCFFSDRGELRQWLKQRDIIVHGLFKNAHDYQKRTDELEECANQGLIYARALYNEAKRLQRLRKNHPAIFDSFVARCTNDKCKGYMGGD